MALTALNPNLLGTDSAGASKLSTAGGLVQLHSTGVFTIANTSANNISVANTGAITFAGAASGITTLAAGNTTITGLLTVSANVNLDSGTLFVDGTNNRVGMGPTSPAVHLDVVSPTNGSTAWAWFHGNCGGAVPPTAVNSGLLLGGNYSAGNSESNIMWGTGYNSNTQHLTFSTWNSSTSAVSEKVRFAANGFVGINTTSPTSFLDVRGDTADVGANGYARGLSVAYDGGSSSPIYFGTEQNSAQKSIYLYGYWLTLRGHQNEGIRFVFSQPAGTAPRSDVYNFQYNTATRPSGSTTWDGFSDIRAKQNVRNLNSALDTVNRLRPVRYDWTDDYADAVNMFNLDKTDPKPYKWVCVKENGYNALKKNNQYGFIAQEFEEVFPHDVSQTKMKLGNEDINDFKTVNFDSLIPVLTKAIQELNAKFEEYKASHP